MRGIRPRGACFEFEYLREFETEFKNNLGYDSVVDIGWIHEKNQRPEISCYCPFKGSFMEDSAKSSYYTVHLSSGSTVCFMSQRSMLRAQGCNYGKLVFLISALLLHYTLKREQLICFEKYFF
jgi:hypothetical protein